MQVGTYEFICAFESDALLPVYKGSTFRGVFGLALKRVICALKRQACDTCLLKPQCLYPLIFETPMVRKPPDGARFTDVPHPFVIEPPRTPDTHFRPGAPFQFSLILFGEVNARLPYFIYAFEQMGRGGVGRRINGKRGRFSLQAVRCGGADIYRKSDNILNAPEYPEMLAPPVVGPPSGAETRLALTLETPLRFKQNNRLSDQLPFDALIRIILRRVCALFSCYGDGAPALDYAGIAARAGAVRIAASGLHWHDWRRYSRRQEQEMQMGGLLGRIVYAGDIAPFLPLIAFAEKVHIGKQTTFGLGKIRAAGEGDAEKMADP